MSQLQPDTNSTFPQLLLILELAGSQYLYAERGPVNIVIDGVEALFHPGLVSQEIEVSVDLWGTAAASRSVSVQVDLSNTVNVRTLLSGGIAIYAMKATLYTYAGGSLDAAQKVAGGFVSDPVYGDPANPKLLGFTIERDFTERALYPSAAAYADEDSFPLAGAIDDGAIGQFYPVPIGKPGYSPETLSGVLKTQPTVRANVGAATASSERIVVGLGDLLATSCRVWSNNNTNETCDLLTDVDQRSGLTVTYLDMTSVVDHDVYADIDKGPTYVAFTGETTRGPSGEGFRGLGDVVVWALGLSSLARTGDVDWRRVYGNQERLNRLGRIDTWIQGQVRPLDWLISDVLAYFPVFISDLGDGIYVDVWNFNPNLSEVELYIDVNLPGYERIAPVAWSSNANANVITVEGHVSAATGGYCTKVSASGDPADLAENSSLASDGAAIRSSSLLQQSFSLFGRNELTLSVPTVQEKSTLDRLLTFSAYKFALPRAEVGYLIPWRKTVPRPGMVALVEDTDVGLNGALGIVTGYRYSGGQLQTRISLLPR